MNSDSKFPNIARSRRKSTIFRAETPPTAAPEHLSRPLFPRNPHFPASGPANGSFKGPHLKSKFLTAIRLRQPVRNPTQAHMGVKMSGDLDVGPALKCLMPMQRWPI